MWGLLALMVRKGSNLDPFYAALRPLFRRVGPPACIYTFVAQLR